MGRNAKLWVSEIDITMIIHLQAAFFLLVMVVIIPVLIVKLRAVRPHPQIQLWGKKRWKLYKKYSEIDYTVNLLVPKQLQRVHTALQKKRLIFTFEIHKLVISLCKKMHYSFSYMYGIGASNPGFWEAVGVSPGQSLDETILLVTVDRRQVGLFKLTVKLLRKTCDGFLFIQILFVPCMNCAAMRCLSSPRLQATSLGCRWRGNTDGRKCSSRADSAYSVLQKTDPHLNLLKSTSSSFLLHVSTYFSLKFSLRCVKGLRWLLGNIHSSSITTFPWGGLTATLVGEQY